MLDNLFTFIKLLAFLLQKGYGARETMRTTAGIYQDLIDFKKLDKNDTIL